MAQYAKDIKCLYCYKTDGEYNCNKCPAKSGSYFEVERNAGSAGSQTPNTNVYLDCFIECKDFFSSIGIKVNNNEYESLVDEIKKTDIKFNDCVKDYRRNYIKYILRMRGCKHVHPQIWSNEESEFYHVSSKCIKYRAETKKTSTTLSGKKHCDVCGSFLDRHDW